MSYNRKCFKIGGGPTYQISLAQQGPNLFTVTYGKQVHYGLTYREAAVEIGECIMHSLACEGLVDAN